MLYNGVLSAGSIKIDCRPCVVKGRYVKENDVLILSSGVILYKTYNMLKMIVFDQEVMDEVTLPLNDLMFLLAKNEQCEVLRV